MTTFTGSPDASPETSTVDGIAQRTSVDETWATIRGGNGNSSPDSGTTIVSGIRASTTTDQFQRFSRAAILVDTSSIPDTDSIDSGKLETWGTNVNDEFAESASSALVESSLASPTTVADADYQNGFGNTTRLASDIAHSAINTDTTANAHTLNAAGLAHINVTGVTQFALQSVFDVDNAEPTWGNDDKALYTFHSAEQTGGEIPLLTVEHSAAAGRIMSSLAAAGGLAGPGGIAGKGGGLAGG